MLSSRILQETALKTAEIQKITTTGFPLSTKWVTLSQEEVKLIKELEPMLAVISDHTVLQVIFSNSQCNFLHNFIRRWSETDRPVMMRALFLILPASSLPPVTSPPSGCNAGTVAPAAQNTLCSQPQMSDVHCCQTEGQVLQAVIVDERMGHMRSMLARDERQWFGDVRQGWPHPHPWCSHQLGWAGRTGIMSSATSQPCPPRSWLCWSPLFPCPASPTMRRCPSCTLWPSVCQPYLWCLTSCLLPAPMAALLMWHWALVLAWYLWLCTIPFFLPPEYVQGMPRTPPQPDAGSLLGSSLHQRHSSTWRRHSAAITCPVHTPSLWCSSCRVNTPTVLWPSLPSRFWGELVLGLP